MRVRVVGDLRVRVFLNYIPFIVIFCHISIACNRIHLLLKDVCVTSHLCQEKESRLSGTHAACRNVIGTKARSPEVMVR